MNETLIGQERIFSCEPSPSDRFLVALDTSRTEPSSARDFDPELIGFPGDEEIFHLQADGFWGETGGFHDAEQLRQRRQQQN